MGPLAISALASGAAGVLPFLGGERANRLRGREAQKDRDFQSAEAATSRDFTSAEAKRQMDFQQGMRSTEWQVGIEDMKKAGLNPALAYQQGGASSPGGASGSGAAGSGSTARAEDTITPAVSSALQNKRLNAEVKLLESQKLNTDMQTTERAGNPRRLLGGMFNWATQGGLGNAVRAAVGGIGTSARAVQRFSHKIAPKSTARLGRMAPWVHLGLKY